MTLATRFIKAMVRIISLVFIDGNIYAPELKEELQVWGIAYPQFDKVLRFLASCIKE